MPVTTILDVVQVAIALALSIISGIGSYLMLLRDGDLSGTILDFITEMFVAVTAGGIAFLVGIHQHWDISIIYLSVILASNNGGEVVTAVRRVNIDMIVNGITNLFKKGGGK